MFRTWCFVAERTYDLSADPVGTLSPFGERDGVTDLERPPTPHPNPLLTGEGRTEFVARSRD